MPVVSGLILCAVGLLFLRRDLRTLWRWVAWRRVPATAMLWQGTGLTGARYDFTLPDGRPITVLTDDVVSRVGSRTPIAVTVLYNPRNPGSDVEPFTVLGLAIRLIWPAVLLGIGIRQFFI